MMSSDIACCWFLDNSSALSCLPCWVWSTKSPCLNCAIVAWSVWPELACMFLPIHWSVYEQQQWVVNVSETVVDIYNCTATHSLMFFDWTAFFKLCLFCPELMCMSLPIHWSVYEQQQRVVNVSETVVDIYNCKATHSLVYFDWMAFIKLCLFLTGAYGHVPSDPLICVWAATKGCECEWNSCCLLYLQGSSLTHVLRLNWFL